MRVDQIISWSILCPGHASKIYREHFFLADSGFKVRASKLKKKKNQAPASIFIFLLKNIVNILLCTTTQIHPVVFIPQMQQVTKVKVKVLVAQLYATLCNLTDCSPPVSCPWDSPGKNTEVGSHSLFQKIFPIQGSKPGLPHSRQILYHLNHQGSPLRCKDTSKPF